MLVTILKKKKKKKAPSPQPNTSSPYYVNKAVITTNVQRTLNDKGYINFIIMNIFLPII